MLKHLHIDIKIRLGYGAAFILLFVSYLLTLYANHQLMEQTKKIIRTNDIIINLENLLSNVNDAEVNVKSYHLTNEEKFFDNYQITNKKNDSLFNLLKIATYDNANFNTDNVDTLKVLVAKKYNYLNGAVKCYRSHKDLLSSDELNSIKVQTNAATDTLNNVIKEMQLQKSILLVQKTKIVDSRYKIMNVFTIISLALASLFAVLGFLTYIRENRARKISDEQVIEFQKELQLRINDLDTANKELIEMRRLEKFAATGRIARNIAHEVRNPLTNIDLAVGQIRSEIPELNENFVMLFDMVNRNSKRINQLITELLLATRFGELNAQPVSINTILEEALELAKDRIMLTHIEIQKNYANNINNIIADKEKVKIAFLNIIVNAVEAIEKDGGILKINTRGENNKCVVEISDNGIGMDAIALSKLFEPYFTTKQKGNGLGLTNTQNIILNHKGNIMVESIPGKGSTFTISFFF